MLKQLESVYRHITLTRPWISWVLLGVLLGSSAYYAQDFRLDASADSLLLQNDKSLAYYREVSERYGADDFLVVTYTPQAELFSDQSLNALDKLSQELAALPRVKSVTNILNVPLIDSPRVSLSEIQDGVRTLADPDTDRKLAKQEFLTSPLYKDLLINDSANTTALQVTLKYNPETQALFDQRQTLRTQQAKGELDSAGEAKLAEIEARYRQASEQAQAASQRTIDEVRSILDRYRDAATIHLGGVSMIASDMIDFVESDIRVFGIGIAVFLLLLLSIAFRQLRWVLLPASICVIASVYMTGLIGLMNWPVTVVSSNFISLTLVITLALVVHLIVRYRELQAEQPEARQPWLIAETIRSKFLPSIYTALTTMVSFGSLLVSDIKPVMDFGLMMLWGVGGAFVIAFLLFPAGLITTAAGNAPASNRDFTASFTRGLANITDRMGTGVLWFYALLILIAGYGTTLLTVENRFIDYFKPTTEIYQGMLQIDRELGGTTPLEVILDAPADHVEEVEAMGLEGLGITATSYWFNNYQLGEVEHIHDYLNGLPETGKVLSLHTTMSMLTMLNKDEPLDDFTLSVMYGRLPQDLKQQLLAPYMSDDGNQIRFSIRVIDSYPGLSRNELLNRIRSDLIEQFDLEPEQVQLSGLLVLYNNVLQSLFKSQILTLGTVFAAIFVMLCLLFRSVPIAFVGVLPTMLSAGVILGLMGWLGIPLDIMTITIAAIAIGIGVDNSIHYIHRYREERTETGEHREAMFNTHASVGRALYYTAITITIGFSILALSNFKPTIYFGLLTGLAMLIAMLANLTLLPALLGRMKQTKV
ncbi:MAG: efflux RND transporter permease subunit [Salinisphaeraceae bacterium]|nr:efflux RND transporter permease subunit [Salinisphaeraceae bacterium]